VNLNKTEDQVKTDYFILNEMPQHLSKPFPVGQGIDFYVDGARFLPDNATITKV
jgi:hypothetical protein